MASDDLAKFGGFLASPIVGGIAGLVVTKQECNTVPGGTLGGMHYDATQVCHQVFNTEIGGILTLIGWAISAVVVFIKS